VASADFVKFALQIVVMLGCALFCGQLMRHLKQPAVLGEMLGGIVLGPTVFGFLAPDVFSWTFQSSESILSAREAIIKLGMLFFLFIAGLETNIADLATIGKKAIAIGFVGTLLPIAAGIGLVYALPREFWGPAVQSHFFSFALFVGMNLANSANPVLARILMDLGLLNKEIGTLCMTSTIVDDLVNWTLFAIILRDIAPVGQSPGSLSLPLCLLLIAFVLGTILLVGRFVGPYFLQWIRCQVSWPNGYIAVTAVIVVVVAAITEQLGVHAFLGAFLVGTALSGKSEEHKQAYDAISTFALSFFAPIYFISMGMTTNFVSNFDSSLVAVILVAALASKLFSVLLGAKLAGMKLDRVTWAIAFGMNARGATGIILAGVGRAAGVIDDRIFVAMVVMALVTSLLAGPAMNWLLGLQGSRSISEPDLSRVGAGEVSA
jgi:Kef-type K+ transport system membrane component KefB